MSDLVAKDPAKPDWSLSFWHKDSIPVETFEELMSRLVGPTNVELGELVGNPRDFYGRSVTITSSRPDASMKLVMAISQSTMGEGDPNPLNSVNTVSIHGPAAPFTAKLAMWHALRDELAKLGVNDRTLISYPGVIVDEAEASGEKAAAASLRADITKARVAEPPSREWFSLSSCRADDLEAVLAAHVNPEAVTDLSLYDCGLTAAPAGLARFPNIEKICLAVNPIDASVVRGLALPKLTELNVHTSAIRALTREDLAGFPALADLHVAATPLEDLDPDIIDACPKLERVQIQSTPLERDAAKVAALRARWPSVVWESKWKV